MASIQFSANLSWLFKNVPTLKERVLKAAAAGFQFLEVMDPYETSAESLADCCRQSSTKFVLLNAAPVDPATKTLGCAIFPHRVEEFRLGISAAIHYALVLDKPIIHIMAGICSDSNNISYESTYLEHLRFAAQELQRHSLLGVIEPINRTSVPDYYLASFDQALDVLKKINSRSLKLLLDVFHLHMIEGSLDSLSRLLPLSGHIQIAQSPGRGSPGSVGDIDYDKVMDVISNSGYRGYIGLEYSSQDEDYGLSWLYNRRLLQLPYK